MQLLLEENRLAEHAVDGIVPNLICTPASAERLAEAVKICSDAQAKTIIAWGGGTAMKLGNTPHSLNVVDYEHLYKKAADLDVPLWIHPSRPPEYPDYVGEKISQYQVWQTLSWLLDSSTAMVRLVFRGVYERYPDLKLIIHHHGALVPLFAKRMQYGWDYFEQNTGKKQPTSISRPFIDHFKKFYCDAATQGYEPLLLKMAYNFFGLDHILFGSDGPMDATGGRAFTVDAKKSVEDIGLSKPDRQKIFSRNILRLFG